MTDDKCLKMSSNSKIHLTVVLCEMPPLAASQSQPDRCDRCVQEPAAIFCCQRWKWANVVSIWAHYTACAVLGMSVGFSLLASLPLSAYLMRISLCASSQERSCTTFLALCPRSRLNSLELPVWMKEVKILSLSLWISRYGSPAIIWRWVKEGVVHSVAQPLTKDHGPVGDAT